MNRAWKLTGAACPPWVATGRGGSPALFLGEATQVRDMQKTYASAWPPKQCEIRSSAHLDSRTSQISTPGNSTNTGRSLREKSYALVRRLNQSSVSPSSFTLHTTVRGPCMRHPSRKGAPSSIDDYGAVVQRLRDLIARRSKVEFHTDFPCALCSTIGDQAWQTAIKAIKIEMARAKVALPAIKAAQARREASHQWIASANVRLPPKVDVPRTPLATLTNSHRLRLAKLALRATRAKMTTAGALAALARPLDPAIPAVAAASSIRVQEAKAKRMAVERDANKEALGPPYSLDWKETTMVTQIDSPDGKTHKDQNRPSPDLVETDTSSKEALPPDRKTNPDKPPPAKP